jgi:exonuclease VII small subunit
MSAKDVPKQGMDKKKSDARSQRHEDKSAQSISSLSSHIEEFENQQIALTKQLQKAEDRIEYYRQRVIRFRALNDELEAAFAEEEFKLWRKTYDQVKTKLKTVEDKLRNIYGSPEKPKKKRNYALEKV